MPRLHSLELSGFKSFARKTTFAFTSPITAIVGPNGSGKSNSKDALQWVLGEQSIKSLRGARGEDLIWSGSSALPRANRASVTLSFDNRARVFALDLDTISIERVVHRDGANEYLLNGSRVRLRDITALLAGANIGASGHHIISQGEADRILACSARERREMVEDALGLRLYHHKLSESMRKLDETEENIRSVEALRREIAPHLRFLGKQAKRIERARGLARDLTALYREYFARSAALIASREQECASRRAALERDTREILAARETLGPCDPEEEDGGRMGALDGEHERAEASLAALREERETLTRELGRLEGVLETLRRSEHAGDSERAAGVDVVALRDLEELAAHVDGHIGRLERTDNLDDVRALLAELRQFLKDFLAERRASGSLLEAGAALAQDKIERLEEEYERIASALAGLALREAGERRALLETEAAIRAERAESEARERTLAECALREQSLGERERGCAALEEELARERDGFKRELGEAALILGREAISAIDPSCESAQDSAVLPQSSPAELFDEQARLRREIERLRIRLEEAGSAESIEALKEYEATAARDEFLARELEDLARSRASLEKLIGELTGELETRFRDGLEKINARFQEFFSLLFSGGRAVVMLSAPRVRREALGDVEEEEGERAESGADADGEAGRESVLHGGEQDVGLLVEVSLPHKRVKGLAQLSGGERTLTSIALIFAISQVNPPPFLILDETDAALDEANSRRYGDMIERLAERSQLILITHNRETMSRAGAIYGVTMAGDGASQLLSIALDKIAGG